MVLKSKGSSPYIYLQEAMVHMINGNHGLAGKIIEYAKSFYGVFYPEGSIEDNNFRQSVDLLSYISINIPDALDILIDDDSITVEVPGEPVIKYN